MSNGSFQIFGTQTNLSIGNVKLGPLVQQFSSVSKITPLPLSATATIITVPTGAAGVAVFGPATGGPVTMTWVVGSGASASNINPSGISIQSFDPANAPTAITITTTGATASTAAMVQIF